jgi:hypothetical protein
MEAELAFETSCFLKRFGVLGGGIGRSHASSSKHRVVEFNVNAVVWESYGRFNQAAWWFVP